MHDDVLGDDGAGVTGGVGSVSRLLAGPVKGLQLAQPETVELTATGVRGDREFFLADEDDVMLSITRSGAFSQVSARFDAAEHRLVLADGTPEAPAGVVERGDRVDVLFYGHHHVAGHVVPGPWAEYFSERVGQKVRLVWAAEPNGGRDLHGVTVLGDASVAAVGAHAGQWVDPRRFRMTIGLAGSPAFAEDEWAGATVTVGSATR